MKTKNLILLAGCFSVAFTVQAQNTLTNGLIAFYTFSGNANDASGNGNNATPAGNYQFLPSYLLDGGAIRTIGDYSQFYAGGGYVALPAFDSNLNSGFSASFWVKNEVPGSGAVGAEAYITFQSGTANSDFNIAVYLNNNQSPTTVSFHDGNGGSPVSMAVGFDQPIDLNSYTNTWKQLAVVVAPGNFSCYMNGNKIFGTNVSYGGVFPAPYAALNRHWWDTRSSARMSATYKNVRIYNRALSDAEVQSLYVIDQPLELNIYTAIELGFLTQSNMVYQIQASPDLITWTNFDSEIQGTGSNWFKTYSIRGQSQLFYRVEAGSITW